MMVFDVKIFLKFTAMPATPPSKGGETYLFINQIIIVVFVIKIFLKLTAMGRRGQGSPGSRPRFSVAGDSFDLCELYRPLLQL